MKGFFNMIFADLTFLYFFLPLNIILYFISKNLTYRNIVLIVFSLFFYAWGEPVWIALLIFSGIINYFSALAINKFRGSFKAKLTLILAVIVNIGFLVLFKYSGFIAESINLLGFHLPVPKFSLPVGISFYTFQTLSYVADVYNNKTLVQKSFPKFFMYVSLYPQLIAGPIVLYKQVALEIDYRKTDIRDISTGATRFIYGLSKKVLVANTAGLLATQYLGGDLSKLSVAGAWFGIFMYALQIYYDFSGYSDMAIGLGRIFGFNYPENFCYPYISGSATEFWRRWHITLSSFFRDYVYIPLGGNRKHLYRNLFIVWFLTGLWHGASFNFIIWGLFWGVLVALEKKFMLKYLEKLPWYITRPYMCVVILVSWAIFYFTDMGKLGQFLKIMFGLSGQPLSDIGTEITLMNNIIWIIMSVFFCMPMLKGFKYLAANEFKPKTQKIILYIHIVINTALLLICTAVLCGQAYNPFLYYKF